MADGPPPPSTSGDSDDLEILLQACLCRKGTRLPMPEGAVCVVTRLTVYKASRRNAPVLIEGVDQFDTLYELRCLSSDVWEATVRR